jgi:hypothetical protein
MVALTKPTVNNASPRQQALEAIDAEFVAENKVAHEISEILSLGQQASTREAAVQNSSAKAQEIVSPKNKANEAGNAEPDMNPKTMAASVELALKLNKSRDA